MSTPRPADADVRDLVLVSDDSLTRERSTNMSFTSSSQRSRSWAMPRASLHALTDVTQVKYASGGPELIALADDIAHGWLNRSA